MDRTNNRAYKTIRNTFQQDPNNPVYCEKFLYDIETDTGGFCNELATCTVLSRFGRLFHCCDKHGDYFMKIKN